MGGGTLPAGLTARLERIAALTSCFSDPLALSERGEHSLEGEGERDEEKTTNRQIDTHRRGRGEREREREREREKVCRLLSRMCPRETEILTKSVVYRALYTFALKCCVQPFAQKRIYTTCSSV